MTRFRLLVEYDGRPFVGWQRQLSGASVQGAIEDAAFAMLRQQVAVTAAGRTDAGVHARGMVAHLDVERDIAADKLREGLNALLRPAPVAVLDCAVVHDGFHARFSCVARHYEYLIVNRRAPLTVDAGLAWRVRAPLDVQEMHDAAQRLVGHHDFTTFRSAHCQAASPLRTLTALYIIRDNDRVRITASARSFLHHQVRSMVGCLALVGQGKWSADDLSAALAARDRGALGYNAPPDGLYFMRADY